MMLANKLWYEDTQKPCSTRTLDAKLDSSQIYKQENTALHAIVCIFIKLRIDTNIIIVVIVCL